MSFYVLFSFSFYISIRALSSSYQIYTKEQQISVLLFIFIRVVRLRFSFRFLGLLLVHFDTRIRLHTPKRVHPPV